ncbi:MAG: XylR family transcriptional regulator [Planctomycetia bacterium]|nr:XylR family transcriptional regulator [Planctomycetia bacterium]
MSHRKVAILVDSANAYSRGMLKGISRYLFENEHWDIIHEERSPNSPVPPWLEHWRGDGIIIRSMHLDLARAAVKTGAQIVDLGLVQLPGLHTVIPDYEKDAQMALQHFRERLFENFAFVAIRGKRYSEERLAAFSALLRGQLAVYELEQEDLAYCGFIPALSEWLKTLPVQCGLFACYDMVGLQTIYACRQAHRKVPRDIAVLGANNDEIQCNISQVPLSSIQVNGYEIGYQAAKMLHALMQGDSPPQEIRVPSLGICTRRSTAVVAVNDSLVQNAYQQIHHHYSVGMTVESLAEKLNVSSRTLQRRFQKSLGRTIHEEIIRSQLQIAVDLLSNTDFSLKTIARRAGFTSDSYFITVYKKFFHETPRRRQKLASPEHVENIS